MFLWSIGSRATTRKRLLQDWTRRSAVIKCQSLIRSFLLFWDSPCIVGQPIALFWSGWGQKSKNRCCWDIYEDHLSPYNHGQKFWRSLNRDYNGITDFATVRQYNCWSAKWYSWSLNYGQSSYCGILPVLWDGPLLCSEVVEDKSPIIDVVETYMKLIWVFNNHCQKPNRSRDIWMCWFGQFWVRIFGHFKALRRTDILTKPFKELLIFHVVLIWLSIS